MSDASVTDARRNDLGNDASRDFGTVDSGTVDLGIDLGTDVGVDLGHDGGARCVIDGDCDDRVFCNGTETCVAGACRSTPRSCDDGIACTRDQCVEFMGACQSTPDSALCAVGSFCSVMNRGCIRAGCMSARDCDDGLACNGVETCSDEGCQRGPAPDCTSTACVVAVCVEGGAGMASCMRTPVDRDRDGFPPTACGGSDCDDGNAAVSPRATEVCANRLDDDCNAWVDCADRACLTSPLCRDGGGANDGGAVDLGRPDLGPSDAGSRDLGVDSGRPDSGVVDAGTPDLGAPDAGCIPTAMREIGIAACTNRRDDDCDTQPDCADPDCRPLGANSECCNGIDDPQDGTGNRDLFTCRCFDNSTCVGVGDFEQVCWTNLASICAPRCNFVGGDLFCARVARGSRCDTVTGQCVR